jgi:hypothetical protein
MHYSTLLPLAALASLSTATYTLVDDYPTGMDFFDSFTFYTVRPLVLSLLSPYV